MPSLEDAITLALKAHNGQVDKAGQPYILHPLRVMLAVQGAGGGYEAQIAAVLHDVVEDSAYSLDDLRREGYSEVVLTALDALTHRDGESYSDFIARAKANPIARQVKLADIEDNLDVRRLGHITPKDAERLERYIRARERLLAP